MSIGPVDYIAVAFPGDKLRGAIVPEIKRLQDAGTIRVLDLVIVAKDAEGNVEAIEASDASPEEAAALAALGIGGNHLLGQEDFEDIGEALGPNTVCGLMVWENVWAAEFTRALREADGVLLGMGRIPAAVIEDLMAESVA